MNSTQENINKLTRIRGYISAVCMAIWAVLSIVCLIAFFADRKNADGSLAVNEIGTWFENAIFVIVLAFFVIGFIPGATRIPAIHRKTKKLLLIIPVGWAIWLASVVYLPGLSGWFFMIADFVKFLKSRKQNSKKESV